MLSRREISAWRERGFKEALELLPRERHFRADVPKEARDAYHAGYTSGKAEYAKGRRTPTRQIG